MAGVAALSSAYQAQGCSADFQSAVSPNFIRQSVGSVQSVGLSQRLAECNSAIQRSTAKPQPTGARVCDVCDSQELCPPSVLTNPARQSFQKCCGSQSRSAKSSRPASTHLACRDSTSRRDARK